MNTIRRISAAFRVAIVAVALVAVGSTPVAGANETAVDPWVNPAVDAGVDTAVDPWVNPAVDAGVDTAVDAGADGPSLKDIIEELTGNGQFSPGDGRVAIAVVDDGNTLVFEVSPNSSELLVNDNTEDLLLEALVVALRLELGAADVVAKVLGNDTVPTVGTAGVGTAGVTPAIVKPSKPVRYNSVLSADVLDRIRRQSGAERIRMACTAYASEFKVEAAALCTPEALRPNVGGRV